jgi:pyruvate,orthophosphate dikinase
MGELLRAARQLEDLHKDVQDIEFTVERGRLYLLQSRAAKRAPQAAVRIAVEMVAEGRISPDEALCRVSPEQVRVLLRPRIAAGVAASAQVLLRGEAASPGIGAGTVVDSADRAEERNDHGEAIVLARPTTSPEDLHGLIAARAAITEHGGSTSHAAVVARALGKPCVVGCGPGTLSALSGRAVTVDGTTGTIYDGLLLLEIQEEEREPDLAQLLRWADERSRIRVATTAPPDIAVIDFDKVADPAAPGGLARALALLPAGSSVSGALFAQDDGAVEAAIRAGAVLIVTSPRLPALLVCIRTQQASNQQHATQ